MENGNIYQRNGYANRTDYLYMLAEEFGIPFNVVYAIANLLGKDEDFDGLICELEDMEEMYV